MTAKEKQFIAQRYYSIWFQKAVSTLKGVKFYLSENDLRNSAFSAHQVAESLYYSILLVFTEYKPKTHNLGKLRKQAKLLSEELFFIFPIEGSKEEKHLFDLLKRGYIDARYRNDYVINEDEINKIIQRLEKMKKIIESSCNRKIQSLF